MNATQLDTFSRIQRDHMKRILRIVLKNRKITRSQLSQLTRLSGSSIVQYTRTLIELGLLSDGQSTSKTAGRRPEYLELNPGLGLNIVVLLTMTRVRALLVDPQGATCFERVASIRPNMPKTELVDSLIELIQSANEAARSELRKMVFGIGISLGGYIDPMRGVSHQYLFSNDWDEVPLTSIMESEFNVPCYIVNDANAAALGEMYHNCALGTKNFLCIWIDEGIGMGIVLGGELYEGHTNCAGEIGHTKVSQQGELCYCGRHGCLETVASQRSVLHLCREGCEKKIHTDLLRLCEGNVHRLSVDHIKTAGMNGDRFTQNVLARIAEPIGIRISDVANLFNPELIVLRGSLIDGNRFLFENMRRIILNNTLQPIADHLTLHFSETDDNVQAKGVSSYIFDRYFT